MAIGHCDHVSSCDSIYKHVHCNAGGHSVVCRDRRWAIMEQLNMSIKVVTRAGWPNMEQRRYGKRVNEHDTANDARWLLAIVSRQSVVCRFVRLPMEKSSHLVCAPMKQCEFILHAPTERLQKQKNFYESRRTSISFQFLRAHTLATRAFVTAISLLYRLSSSLTHIDRCNEPIVSSKRSRDSTNWDYCLELQHVHYLLFAPSSTLYRYIAYSAVLMVKFTETKQKQNVRHGIGIKNLLLICCFFLFLPEMKNIIIFYTLPNRKIS